MSDISLGRKHGEEPESCIVKPLLFNRPLKQGQFVVDVELTHVDTACSKVGRQIMRLRFKVLEPGKLRGLLIGHSCLLELTSLKQVDTQLCELLAAAGVKEDAELDAIDAYKLIAASVEAQPKLSIICEPTAWEGKLFAEVQHFIPLISGELYRMNIKEPE